MKYFLTILLFVSQYNSYSQVTREEVVNRLYYTCKIWGYIKYHHTGVNAYEKDWDSILISHLDKIKSAPNQSAFQDSLHLLIQSAGPLFDFINYWGYRGDSIKLNKDFNWMYATEIPTKVRDTLLKIKSNFKNEAIRYFSYDKHQLIPFIVFDDKYYSEIIYQDENKMLLSLFRYWNLIEYTYQFKNELELPWDSTLKKYIDPIFDIKTREQYHLLFNQLNQSLNDSKGKFYSYPLERKKGNSYFPFLARYVEGKTIVYKKLDSINYLEIGDEILEIDAIPIDELRNQSKLYAHGSNDASIQRNIDYHLIRGQEGTYNILIKKKDGSTQIYSIQRRPDWKNVMKIPPNPKPLWDTVIDKNCRLGYWDFRTLTGYDLIDRSFLDSMWVCDAWIVDLRGTPLLNFDTNFFKYIYNEPEFIYYTIEPNLQIPGEFYSFRYIAGRFYNNPKYENKIILLVDEYTRDNGEYFAAAFQSRDNVIIVGSMTDGSANSDGNAIVKLPDSIIANYTLHGAYDKFKKPYHKNGIKIDHTIRPTVKGIQEGRDEILEFALKCNNIALSTQDHFVSNDFINIYPNPLNDFLNLETNINLEKIFIYNLQGQLIKTINLIQKKQKIDLKMLSKGIYIVRFENSNLTYKIIKE